MVEPWHKVNLRIGDIGTEGGGGGGGGGLVGCRLAMQEKHSGPSKEKEKWHTC